VFGRARFAPSVCPTRMAAAIASAAAPKKCRAVSRSVHPPVVAPLTRTPGFMKPARWVGKVLFRHFAAPFLAAASRRSFIIDQREQLLLRATPIPLPRSVPGGRVMWGHGGTLAMVSFKRRDEICEPQTHPPRNIRAPNLPAGTARCCRVSFYRPGVEFMVGPIITFLVVCAICRDLHGDCSLIFFAERNSRRDGRKGKSFLRGTRRNGASQKAIPLAVRNGRTELNAALRRPGAVFRKSCANGKCGGRRPQRSKRFVAGQHRTEHFAETHPEICMGRVKRIPRPLARAHAMSAAAKPSLRRFRSNWVENPAASSKFFKLFFFSQARITAARHVEKSGRSIGHAHPGPAEKAPESAANCDDRIQQARQNTLIFIGVRVSPRA